MTETNQKQKTAVDEGWKLTFYYFQSRQAIPSGLKFH